MNFRNTITRTATAASLALLLCACSDDKASSSATTLDLPHFEDIPSATAPIQAAARAVVRLHTAGAYGTGEFISATGVLLTNNHVLGSDVCPVEGCYVDVSFLHQRGQTSSDPVTCFAVPLTIDAGLDIAVLQLYDETATAALTTPDYLELDPKDGAALLDQHVTIVGHPEGTLKKWTDGVVYDAQGKWITTTAFILPGDSGSPILSDAGKLVGILHRGPESLDLVSDDGVNVYSVGTASAAIAAAQSAALPSTVISTAASTTKAEFLANQLVYLNARSTVVNIAGTSVSVLTPLAEACDAALSSSGYATLDDFASAVEPCYDAQSWIECRKEAVASGSVCPEESSRDAWQKRYQQLNDWQTKLNGMADYPSVSFGIAALEATEAQGTAAGADALENVLAAAAPSLDFELAYYLAAFSINRYGDATISNYISNYRTTPHYELNAKAIAYAATWLYGNGTLNATRVMSILNELHTDAKVDLGAKLAIEDLLYESGALR
jgi:hypothetical protein